MGKTKKLLMEMEDDAYHLPLDKWVKKYGTKNVHIFNTVWHEGMEEAMGSYAKKKNKKNAP